MTCVRASSIDVANLSPKLDNRLVHLRFDLLLERDFAALENFLNVRAQFARLRIDDGKLFFNSEGIDMLLHRRRDKLSEKFRPVILTA